MPGAGHKPRAPYTVSYQEGFTKDFFRTVYYTANDASKCHTKRHSQEFTPHCESAYQAFATKSVIPKGSYRSFSEEYQTKTLTPKVSYKDCLRTVSPGSVSYNSVMPRLFRQTASCFLSSLVPSMLQECHAKSL